MNDAVPPVDVDPDDDGERRGASALLRDLDRLLRGRFTTPERLRTGRTEIPLRRLAAACLVLGAIYGAAMGLFAVTTRPADEGMLQVLSSALKVPLLFLLTLVVTFPSLYVVSALARSRLRPGDTLRLLLAAIAVHLALLASLGPVAAFFTLSTDSYPFMKLLHVAFFAASGLAGLAFLRRALDVIFEGGPSPDPARVAEGETAAPAPGTEPIRRVFRVWIVIYGVVGAQMGWILRPFIGAPHLEFTWFRARESNIVEALVHTFADLLR